MNITLAFQELDDLIVKNTQPPATPMLRNKLHTLREQTEAYITEKENVSTLLQKAQADNIKLVSENSRLVALNKKPRFKPLGPPTYEPEQGV